MSDVPVLEVNHLAVSYRTRKGDVPAVRDVSFVIRQGENLGLVGESGCGKSTVAFSLVNYLGRNGYIADGSIQFKGQEMRHHSQRELRKLRGADISMVYQEPMSALNPTMPVGRQMMETLVAHQGMSRREARSACLKALQDVYMPDPESVLGRYAHQISGGQQQRVLIAMALLNNPALLVMDEPTTALDVTVEAAVLDLIADLEQRFNTATLYISHNLGVVARVSDKVAVMYAGEIVELASAKTIFREPLHPYTVGLMRCLPDVDAPKGTRILHPIPGQVPSRYNLPSGCLFAPRCEFAIDACHEARPPMVEVANEHTSRCIRSTEFQSGAPWAGTLSGDVDPCACSAKTSTESVLSAQHVKTYYPVAIASIKALFDRSARPAVKAVDDVSIDLKRGCTLGIVGESGCGKSTLAKTIVGLEPLHDGDIEFLGIEINNLVEQRSMDVIRQMQMVFQNPDGTLNPSYSIGDQIATSVRRFAGIPKDHVRDEVIRLLKSVKLDGNYYGRFPRQLSGGEKQRVGIARAIAGNPALLVCDEPVSALDVSVQAAILTLMLEIQEQRNTSIILISHDLSTVRFFSDYVAVMYLGRVVEIGPCEAIYAPPFHPYTAALLAAVPRPDPEAEPDSIRLSGSVPSPINPPLGCRFNTRCPFKIGDICETMEPRGLELGDGHRIYCHLDLTTLEALGQCP